MRTESSYEGNTSCRGRRQARQKHKEYGEWPELTALWSCLKAHMTQD